MSEKSIVPLKSAQPEQMVQVPKEKFEHLKMLASFVSVVTGGLHDIKNVACALEGTIHILEEIKDPSEREECILEVRKCAGRLAEIVRNINITIGNQLKKEDQRVDLRIVLGGRFLNLLQVTDRSKIDIKLNDNLAPIACNPDQLMLVFLNLVLNALEAGAEKITIRAFPFSEEPKHFVEIDVSDNGFGIPLEIINRVFDPFFSTKDNGTGLGLSNCRAIIEELNGQIGVQTSNTGTTFSIVLPTWDKASGIYEVC